jgi:FkbM family methyltransferase
VNVELNANLSAPDALQRVTPEVIRWAYRLFLGRMPESTDVVDLYVRECPTVDDVVRELVKSREFRLKRLSESGISAVVPEDKQFVMTELDDGTRFWINMKDRYVSRAIHMNDYEGMETEFVRSTVRPGMRVLDIGANLGWFTVLMAKLVGPTGYVTSFEPRGDLFHYLSRTVIENRLHWVKLHNCALGDAVGEVELHWPKDGVNPGGTQLHVARSSADDFYYQKIGMKVLDQEVTGKIDFIKIDVEGAEKLVFSGARRILSESKPVIMAEVSPDALKQVSKVSFDEYILFLKTIQYTPFKFTESGLKGEQLTEWPYSDPNMLINVVMLPNA